MCVYSFDFLTRFTIIVIASILLLKLLVRPVTEKMVSLYPQTFLSPSLISSCPFRFFVFHSNPCTSILLDELRVTLSLSWNKKNKDSVNLRVSNFKFTLLKPTIPLFSLKKFFGDVKTKLEDFRSLLR